MSKMRTRPPQPASVDDFIAGQETETDQSHERDQDSTVVAMAGRTEAAPRGRNKHRLPWTHSSVREDVLKTYNLRLPEPYMLKLKHIAENTPASMQRFCLDALLPAIDRKIKELTGN